MAAIPGFLLAEQLSDPRKYGVDLVMPAFYAAMLVPEIADDIVAVDEGMRLGYAWKFGPFELIDQIGADTVVALLKAGNIEVPPLLQKAVPQQRVGRVCASLSLHRVH